MMATSGQRAMPHFDKRRRTPEGAWMTRCRLMAGLRQSDLSPVLESIRPGMGNQGRPCELETGKRPMNAAIKAGLHAEFRQRLGANCPPPPP